MADTILGRVADSPEGTAHGGVAEPPRQHRRQQKALNLISDAKNRAYGHFKHEFYALPIFMNDVAQESPLFSLCANFSDVWCYACTWPCLDFVAEITVGILAGKVYPPQVMELYKKFGGTR